MAALQIQQGNKGTIRYAYKERETILINGNEVTIAEALNMLQGIIPLPTSPDFEFVQSATYRFPDTTPPGLSNVLESITITLDKPRRVYVFFRVNKDIEPNESVHIAAILQINGATDTYFSSGHQATTPNYFGEATLSHSGYLDLAAGVNTITLLGGRIAQVNHSQYPLSTWLSIAYIK